MPLHYLAWKIDRCSQDYLVAQWWQGWASFESGPVKEDSPAKMATAGSDEPPGRPELGPGLARRRMRLRSAQCVCGQAGATVTHKPQLHIIQLLCLTQTFSHMHKVFFFTTAKLSYTFTNLNLSEFCFTIHTFIHAIMHT